jgi:hypothetical protein
MQEEPAEEEAATAARRKPMRNAPPTRKNPGMRIAATAGTTESVTDKAWAVAKETVRATANAAVRVTAAARAGAEQTARLETEARSIRTRAVLAKRPGSPYSPTNDTHLP